MQTSWIKLDLHVLMIHPLRLAISTKSSGKPRTSGKGLHLWFDTSSSSGACNNAVKYCIVVVGARRFWSPSHFVRWLATIEALVRIQSCQPKLKQQHAWFKHSYLFLYNKYDQFEFNWLHQGVYIGKNMLKIIWYLCLKYWKYTGSHFYTPPPDVI